MKTLIIKIGGDPKKDIKEVFDNPKKNGQPGTSTLYLNSVKDLYEMLSPKRMGLLLYLAGSEESAQNTTTVLANKLGRKQEAISRDTAILEKHGLISKTKDKQKVFIKSAYGAINLCLTAESQS